MAQIRRAYWDACTWLGLINEERDKIRDCRACIQAAEKGQLEIVTSTITLAEVYKVRCGPRKEELPVEGDQIFEEFLTKPWVTMVDVTFRVGVVARRLLRRNEGLEKPNDAIHLATALLEECDVLHTFDGADLLALDGKERTPEGSALTICKPLDPNREGGSLFRVEAKEARADGQ